MANAEEQFLKIADTLPDVTLGKMFGKQCYKVPTGKAAVILFHDNIVFKLMPDEQEKALKLAGAHVFEPAPGRPMNGWISVPPDHSKKWKGLAKKAVEYVSSITN